MIRNLNIFAGEIYENYALCAVFGLLSHVISSGWVWILAIASVERYVQNANSIISVFILEAYKSYTRYFCHVHLQHFLSRINPCLPFS